jgi:hypothetical protein
MKPRRKIGVVAAPGVRRDADIQELAVVAAHTFDSIIVREDDDLRGRERGEIANLIAETIRRTRPSLPLSITLDETESVDQALRMAQAGDTIVLFIDSVDAVIEQVKLAGQAAAIEQSDAFWCPVPEPSHGKKHAQAELGAEAAILTTSGSQASGANMTSGNGSSARQPGPKTPVADLVLHDGEPDGHS